MDNARKLRWRRPRFSLAALLVLITVVAIPLAYVAQRRSFNLRRKAAYEALLAKQFKMSVSWPIEEARNGGSNDPFDNAPAPAAPRPWRLSDLWTDLCLDGASPQVRQFTSAEWTDSGRTSKPHCTDDDLRFLVEHFPEVKYVYVWLEPQITDAGLSRLADLPKLNSLDLYDAEKITGEFLQRFSKRSRFRVLRLHDLPNLDGRQLKKLGELQLNDLVLLRNAKLSDETLTEVHLPSSLTDLELAGNAKFDETLRRWLREVQLELLELDVNIHREAAPALATQSKLKRLRIVNAPLVDEDFAFLEHCSDLESLQLECMPIQGAFLAKLPAPEKLEQLSLRATLLRDESLSALTRFSNSNFLLLDWTPITGEGFVDALKWQKQQKLSLIGCRFSEKGKEAFSQTSGLGEVALPDNWTEDDMQRFTPRSRPILFTFSLVQPASKDPSQGAMVWHQPKVAKILEMKIDRGPAQDMKPVRTLLEEGRNIQARFDRGELPPR